jgi:putative sterol carrier protein
MELAGGDFKTAKGKADSPRMTITQAVGDWREINAGRLNPQMAFMSGKIKISGDMSLAMKLGSIMGG